MTGKVKESPRFDVVQFVNDNCVAICTCMVIMALSFTGVGNGTIVCALGLVLCIAMFLRSDMRLDLWVFVPLVFYVLLNAYATLRVNGTLIGGYFCVQVILPVIYLAIASMDKREALVARQGVVAWAILAAAIAIVLFVLDAFGGVISRLSWPLTGANALGIFLVIAWFALVGLKGDDRTNRILRRGEPIVLAALALTLSLGSFGALVIGLIAMLLYRKRGRSWGQIAADAAVIVVKLALAVGTGLILYLAPTWGNLPPFDVVALAYLVALVVFWPQIEDYLRSHMRLTAPLAILGPALAVLAALIRGSAPATFAERLEMIQNGIGYLGVNPLFGIGPYQWRMYNMLDADTYFNTWHIHNSLLHVSVELGIIAALMLVVIAVRFFVKRRDPAQRGGAIAFIVHNMMDTSFFFPCVTGLLLVTVGSPRTVGVELAGWPYRLIVGACALALAVLVVCGLAWI